MQVGVYACELFWVLCAELWALRCIDYLLPVRSPVLVQVAYVGVMCACGISVRDY